MIPETVKSNAPKTEGDQTRDAYLKQLETQGKQWKDQVAKWGIKVEQGPDAAKAGFVSWRKQFDDKVSSAYRRMETLRAAKPDAWQHAKGGMDTAWNDVAIAFDNAKKKYA